MEDIIIKIKSELINYNLYFDNRINIIRGDSATGKSTLVKLIDDKRKSKIDIQSNYNIVHLTLEIINLDIKFDKNTVYIMDENDGIEDTLVTNIINKSKNKFILITRDSNLENISYGIGNIYEIHKSGNININKHKYINIRNNNLNINLINSILTEDSGSGLQFYKNYKNFNVQTSNGNSNINKMVKNNQIVVIDSIAFGPYIKILYKKIVNNNILLISPKSFEWLILTSNIFRLNDNKLYSDYLNYKHNITEEKFYENTLKSESNKINIKYSKSKLNEKFLEEIQFNKINERIEELFDININKLNEKLKSINEDYNKTMRWL